MKKILVIDGQGGRIGALLVTEIKKRFPLYEVTAVGTNVLATGAMLKAGADNGATGENPVAVAARTADVIVGPIGIVIADSLLGEVTPNMALAVGQSQATKILIPMMRCNNLIAGIRQQSMSDLLEDVLNKIADFT